MPTAALPRTPLVVVTGKGGVGKTTVAAAIGAGLAAEGARTVVCEVSGQTRLPELFGVDPGPAGREVQLDERLWSVSVDPVEGLTEWLGRQLPSRMAGLLTRSGTFGALVAAAPGAPEVVAITKAWELGADPRWDRSREPFDHVVLDAPASGHGLALLRTPRTYTEIARVGPVAGQARRVDEALRDPAWTSYVAVCAPTELAVSETVELEARLREDLGAELGLVVCNAVLPRRFSGGELGTLEGVGGRAGRAVRAAAGRARLHQGQLARLRRQVAAPVVTLPWRPGDGLRREELPGLARRLGARAG